MSEGLPPLTSDSINDFITTNVSEQDLNKPSIKRVSIPTDSEIRQQTQMSAVDRLQQFAGGQFPKAPPTPQEIYEQQVQEAYNQKTKAEGHQKRVEAAGINIPTPEEQVN